MSPSPAPAETTTGEEPRESGASLPAFLPPRSQPSRNRRPSSPRSASPSQGLPDSPPDDDEADDASAWDEDREQLPETDSASSPGSTDEAVKARFRPIDPTARKLYAQAVEKGALIASGLVNTRMDPDGDAFVMRKAEREDVAAPASRLLARHVPLPGSALSEATDLSDLIELIVAVAGYAFAAFSRRAAGMVDGTGMPDGTEGDVSDWRDQDEPAAGPMPAWPMPNMPPMVGVGS